MIRTNEMGNHSGRERGTEFVEDRYGDPCSQELAKRVSTEAKFQAVFRPAFGVLDLKGQRMLWKGVLWISFLATINPKVIQKFGLSIFLRPIAQIPSESL